MFTANNNKPTHSPIFKIHKHTHTVDNTFTWNMCIFLLYNAQNTWNTYAVQTDHLFFSFQLIALDWPTTYLAYLFVSYMKPIHILKQTCCHFLLTTELKIEVWDCVLCGFSFSYHFVMLRGGCYSCVR